MPDAPWIITFDDGPLPADINSLNGATEAQMLQPLADIIKVLAEYPGGPAPAVFFLRGPAYPWPERPPHQQPPDEWFRHGVQMIEQGGHRTALHCFRHDPDLWWGWLLRGNEIRQDLDNCLQYFEPMVSTPVTALRPPYGQGGFAAMSWAQEHNLRYHGWDIDTEDWRHHEDARVLRSYQGDPAAHLNDIRNLLAFRMAFMTWDPGPKDFLLHVSVRTAGYLKEILDTISEVSRQQGCEPRFVVPDDYV